MNGTTSEADLARAIAASMEVNRPNHGYGDDDEDAQLAAVLEASKNIR